MSTIELIARRRQRDEWLLPALWLLRSGGECMIIFVFSYVAEMEELEKRYHDKKEEEIERDREIDRERERERERESERVKE